MSTCQICGRDVKAKNGKIAHHGYKRPGDGWQTASCLGARFAPYEVSNERISAVIEMANNHMIDLRQRVNGSMTNPPETLFYNKRGYGGTVGELVNVDRPEGFDPKTAYHTNRPNAYDTLFFNWIIELERGIKGTEKTVEYLEDRLAKWVAPKQPAALIAAPVVLMLLAGL